MSVEIEVGDITLSQGSMKQVTYEEGVYKHIIRWVNKLGW